MPASRHENREGAASSRERERKRGGVELFLERAILGVVLAILLWGPLFFGALPPASFLVIQALTIVALGLWAVRIWAQRDMRLLWPPTCWFAVIFILYALVRCRLVTIEFIARQDLVHIIVYASLFFLILNNLHQRETVNIIALTLVVLGIVLSWDGIYQFATKSSHVWGFERRAQFIGRGGATYINPDHLAGFLGMTIPVALAYALMSRLAHTWKVLLAYGVVAMMAGVCFTVSRGGILATGAALAVFCLVLLFQRGSWIVALGIAVGLIALVIAFGAGIGTVQKRFHESLMTGKIRDERFGYWSAAIHIFKDHPLWGGGPGHFDAEFAKYRPTTIQGRPIFVHNDYLNTLCEWGSVGMAIVAAFCMVFYYGAFRTWPVLGQPDPEGGGVLKGDRSAFLMGACIGLLALLFHSVVDFNMHIPANAITAMALMALVTAQWRFANDRLSMNPHLIGKIVLTLAIAAAMGWLGEQEWSRGREVYWQWKTNDEHLSENERVAALEKAYDAEPNDYENSYNLGEYFRLASQEGNPGYEALGNQALEWYGKSLKANPLDAMVPMRYGMGLDCIGKTNEATAYFDQAEKLDPNNCHVAYYTARHYVESGDNQTAMRWFQRSLELFYTDLAWGGMQALKERMADPYGLYKN